MLQRIFIQPINVRTGERKPAFDASALTTEQRQGFALGVRQYQGQEWVVNEYKAQHPRGCKPQTTEPA